MRVCSSRVGVRISKSLILWKFKPSLPLPVDRFFNLFCPFSDANIDRLLKEAKKRQAAQKAEVKEVEQVEVETSTVKAPKDKKEAVTKAKAEKKTTKNMTESQKMDVEVQRIKKEVERVSGNLETFKRTDETLNKMEERLDILKGKMD